MISKKKKREQKKPTKFNEKINIWAQKKKKCATHLEKVKENKKKKRKKAKFRQKKRRKK